MHKSIVLLVCATLLATSFAASADQPCRYSAPRNAEIDAAGLKLLAVEIGPDNLVIQGQPGLAKIEVHGTACASNEKWLPDIKVETARQGDTASIVAQDGNRGNRFFSIFNLVEGGTYAYLKLDVRVPQALAVKLKLGSGDANASKLAALDATVGSGDLKASGIAGELGLRVGSGDAVANDVGSLNLSSVDSGDATIDGIRGDAKAGSVGSGDLGLRNVNGNVSIGSISSGDAKATGIGGGVTARSIGSGDLVVRNVKGSVTVGSVASGDVSIEHAGGNVHADSVGSGDFGASDVGGDFSVGSVGSGDVRHHDVKGKVSVPRSDD
ncbi:MAG: hypothetical protein JSR56_00445 [Proteobacteria bacterium]|nr:hypothetical protein [Pseudomonadota bacterium]